jgi:hypothetical protein
MHKIPCSAFDRKFKSGSKIKDPKAELSGAVDIAESKLCGVLGTPNLKPTVVVDTAKSEIAVSSSPSL